MWSHDFVGLGQMKERKHTRVELEATGCYRSPRGMAWEIHFADLSEGGCRLEDADGSLNIGEELSVYIAGTGPHIANVRWTEGGFAGLSFAQPLPKQVFELLSDKKWEDAIEAYSDRANLKEARFV